MDTVEARGLNHDEEEFPVLPAPPASAVHTMRTPVVEAPVALKVLCVDDCEDDVILIVEALKAGGFVPEYERVCTRPDLDTALDARTWDLVVSD